MTNYIDLIQSLDSEAQLSEGVQETEFQDVEKTFSVALPEELKNLYLETDGVIDNLGAELIWSVMKLIITNKEFRKNVEFKELYMPFDNLLFFGEDGGGNQFAYTIQADGKIHNLDIFIWNHEDDSRIWYAGNLKEFLEASFNLSEND